MIISTRHTAKREGEISAIRHYRAIGLCVHWSLVPRLPSERCLGTRLGYVMYNVSRAGRLK